MIPGSVLLPFTRSSLLRVPLAIVYTRLRHPKRSRPTVRLILVGCVIGSMLLRPLFGQNVTPVDVLLTIAIAVAARRKSGAPSPVRRLIVASAPWFWLILLGSVAGLLDIGLAAWAVDTLIRDAFSFAIFFAMLELARRDGRGAEAALTATAVAVGALSLLILATGSGYRPGGTFANPNYAGHFLAMGAALVVVTGHRSPAVRAVLMVLAAAAIARTGSFGSASMLLAGATYFVLGRVRYDRRAGTRVAFAALLLLLSTSMWKAYTAIDRSEFVAFGASVSSYRLENTSKIREQLWSNALALVPDHPLGVGPYGVKTRELLGRDVEVHNDFLAYLVERSVIGFVGLLGFLATLWRAAARNGPTRILLVMFAVSSVFRETLHFRHAWIFLGVSLAYEYRVRAERSHQPPAPPAAVPITR